MEKSIDDEKVWYVCYGSNMLRARFEIYITGGICEYNGKKYKGCKDTTLPTCSIPCEIPYNMYLGNNSSSWGITLSLF